MKYLLSSACIAGLAFAGSASAQVSLFCSKAGASDWAEVVEAFVGDWRTEHQSGYARMGAQQFVDDRRHDDETAARLR